MPATQPRRGLLLILSSPSGAGKSTLTRNLCQRETNIDLSVSVTTRERRPSEIDGVHYRFIDRDTFEALRDHDDLLEWAEVHGNCYGTPRKPVDDAIAHGKLIILEIDVQGAMQVKAKLPEAYCIFVLPPSERVLLDRLRGRGREAEAVIQKRFAKAKLEIIQAWQSGAYDDFVVNRDLGKAIAETVALVRQRLPKADPVRSSSRVRLGPH